MEVHLANDIVWAAQWLSLVWVGGFGIVMFFRMVGNACQCGEHKPTIERRIEFARKAKQSLMLFLISTIIISGLCVSMSRTGAFGLKNKSGVTVNVK